MRMPNIVQKSHGVNFHYVECYSILIYTNYKGNMNKLKNTSMEIIKTAKHGKSLAHAV